MKTYHPYLVAVALAAVFAPVAPAADVLPLNVEKPLQVVVHDQIIPRAGRGGGFASWSMESERFHMFSDLLRRALKKAGYSGEIKFEQFVANNRDAEQRLSVYLQRWERSRTSFGSFLTTDMLISVLIEVDGETYDLGNFSAQETHSVMGGIDTDDFRPVAERTIANAIECYKAAIAERKATITS